MGITSNRASIYNFCVKLQLFIEQFSMWFWRRTDQSLTGGMNSFWKLSLSYLRHTTPLTCPINKSDTWYFLFFILGVLQKIGWLKKVNNFELSFSYAIFLPSLNGFRLVIQRVPNITGWPFPFWLPHPYR